MPLIREKKQIPVTEKEVKDIFNFLLEKAKKEHSLTINVKTSDIHNLMADKEWMEQKDKNKKEMFLKRANNRVRFLLETDLKKLGVESIIPIDDISYEYVLARKLFDSNLDIQIVDNQNTFSDFETPFIPPHNFGDILIALQHGNRPILVGPKGCGKSRSLEEAGAKLGLNQVRIPLGQVSNPEDLIGTKEIIEQNGASITKFNYGLITNCLKNGELVILDELDSVKPEVALSLNMAFESEANVVCLTEKGIEVIKPHPEARICATANTWGYGDETGMFVGTESQNRATWDRFSPKIEMDYDERIERHILKDIAHQNVIDALYGNKKYNWSGIITVIRQEIKKGTIYDTISIRPIFKMAKMIPLLGWHKSIQYFIINEFHPDFRMKIAQIIKDDLDPSCIPSVNDYNASNTEDYIPALENKMKQHTSDDRYKGFFKHEI